MNKLRDHYDRDVNALEVKSLPAWLYAAVPICELSHEVS